MGLNVNLANMLGLPHEIRCPQCHKNIDSRFDDFDIECGNPNPSMGVWKFSMYCPICEHEWKTTYEVMSIEKIPSKLQKQMERVDELHSLLCDGPMTIWDLNTKGFHDAVSLASENQQTFEIIHTPYSVSVGLRQLK